MSTSDTSSNTSAHVSPTLQPPHDPNWVLVGRFGRPYGLKGQLYLHSFSEPSDSLLHYEDLHLWHGRSWQPCALTCHTQGNKAQLLATLEGVSSPEQAQQYTQRYIAVSRQQLPKLADGDYYWHDLIGLALINTTGHPLGQVQAITDHGAHALFMVRTPEDKNSYIPYTDQVVAKIDLAAQQIIVDWPEQF